MEIFKLFGSVLVDTASAESSIQKTTEKAGGLGSKLAGGIKTAAKWGAGIAGAAVAVGGAMITAAKGTAEAADKIDKASQRMGVDAEYYQELAYAADLSGVNMAQMEKAAKALEAAGSELSLEEAMNQILSVEDASERSQMAAELFGNSVAYNIQPLLNAGADGFKAMTDEANALGLVMSGDSVEAGAAFNDQFTKVKKSLTSLKNNIMNELMPSISGILDWVTENMPTIQETVKTIMEAIWPLVKAVLDLIMAALPPLMTAIKDLIDWVKPYLDPVIEAVTKVLQGFIKLLNGDFEGFAGDIKDAITGVATAMTQIGRDILGNLKAGLTEKWESVKSWVSEKTEWIKNMFKGAKDEANSTGEDGSHASGLNYVPYDGYKATLHRGETILSAGNSQSMVEDIVNGLAPLMQGGGGGTYTINVQLDKKTIAQTIFEPLQEVSRQKGVALG